MNNKIVVYTASFGPHVKLMPQPALKNTDFICITDRLRNVKGWTFKIIEPLFPDDYTRSNRYYKLHPHLFFPDYHRSIYIDSNFIVIQLPDDRFESMMQQTPMLVFDHNQTKRDKRNCVYQEAFALLGYVAAGKAKDDPIVIEEMISNFKQQGYPVNNGLIKGGVLIRDHLHPGIIRAMEEWWFFVKNKSKRDQLSFNYVAWKTGLAFGYLNGDIRRGNPWFYYAGKGDRSEFYSLFKFRVRKLFRRK